MPLDLTVHGVQDDDAVVGEDIEHVPHTEALEEQTQLWSRPSEQLAPGGSWATLDTHETCSLDAAGTGMKMLVLVKVGRGEVSRWCVGSVGRQCPEGCQSVLHIEGSAVARPSSQTRTSAPGHPGLATNTHFQINYGLDCDIQLIFPVLKGQASLGHLLSKIMAQMTPGKQRLLVYTHFGPVPTSGKVGSKESCGWCSFVQT